MLVEQRDQGGVLRDIREMLAANDPGTVKSRPSKPPSGSSKVVKLEALQQMRAEHNEFLRRLNKALALDWRTVRPHDEHGHGDPAVDWVSRNGHMMLEHSDGVRLLLKRFGQAQLFKHAEPPTVIERDEPERFNEIIRQWGPANFGGQQKFDGRFWSRLSSYWRWGINGTLERKRP